MPVRDSDVEDDEGGEEESYHGYSSLSIAKGDVACPFPWKLHRMLDGGGTGRMTINCFMANPFSGH
jgi:hypothetical protein